MADILDEIVRDNSYHKKIAIYKRVLPLIIFATICVVAVMLIYNAYSQIQEESKKKLTNVFIEALNPNLSQAQQKEKLKFLISANKSKVRELAHIALAYLPISSIKTENNNLQDIRISDINHVREVLQSIMRNPKYSKLIKAYATVSYLGILVDYADINNEQDKSAIAECFININKQPNMPFRGLIHLYQALWYRKIGNETEARRYLDQIIESNYASNEVKSQAKILKENIN